MRSIRYFKMGAPRQMLPQPRSGRRRLSFPIDHRCQPSDRDPSSRFLSPASDGPFQPLALGAAAALDLIGEGRIFDPHIFGKPRSARPAAFKFIQQRFSSCSRDTYTTHLVPLEYLSIHCSPHLKRRRHS
jgi:hypothetical protein